MYLLGAGQSHQSGNCFRISSDTQKKSKYFSYLWVPLCYSPITFQDLVKTMWANSLKAKLRDKDRKEFAFSGWILPQLFPLVCPHSALLEMDFKQKPLQCLLCVSFGFCLEYLELKAAFCLFVCWFGGFCVFFSSEMQDLVGGQRWTLSLPCVLAKSGLKLGQFSS